MPFCNGTIECISGNTRTPVCVSVGALFSVSPQILVIPTLSLDLPLCHLDGKLP